MANSSNFRVRQTSINTGSRTQSRPKTRWKGEDPKKSDLSNLPRYSGGGGKTLLEQVPETKSGTSQQEQERQRAEIQREKQAQLRKSAEELRKNLRNASNIQERKNLVQEYNKRVLDISNQAQLQKLKKGVVKSAVTYRSLKEKARGIGQRVSATKQQTYDLSGLEQPKKDQPKTYQISESLRARMEAREKQVGIPTKSTITPEYKKFWSEKKVGAFGVVGEFVKEEVIGGKTFYKTFPKIAEAEAKRDTEAETRYLHEQFPPLKLFDVASKGIVSGAELIGGRIPEEQRKQTIRGVSNILKIGAFSPLMATGTAQQSEYVYDYTRGTFVKKDQVEKAVAQIVDSFDDAYKSGGQAGVLKNLNKVLSKVKDKRGVENLLKNLADKGYIKGYAVDTKTGSFVIEGLSPARTSTISVELDFSALNTAPRMRYLGETITGTQLLQPQGRFEGVELGQNIMEVGVETKATKTNIIGSATKSLLGSSTLQKPTQQQKSILDTSTTPATAQTTKPSTATTSLLGLSQLSRLDTATRQTTKQTQKYKQPNIFLTPQLSSGLSAKEQMIKVGKGLFEAFSKKGGKPFKIGSFKTQQEAESKLKGVLTGTLRASGWVEKSGEKQKPLSFGSMFRPSKRNENIIVEKARYRLDQPSEIREIQFFKQSSPSFTLFGTKHSNNSKKKFKLL